MSDSLRLFAYIATSLTMIRSDHFRCARGQPGDFLERLQTFVRLVAAPSASRRQEHPPASEPAASRPAQRRRRPSSPTPTRPVPDTPEPPCPQRGGVSGRGRAGGLGAGSGREPGRRGARPGRGVGRAGGEPGCAATPLAIKPGAAQQSERSGAAGEGERSEPSHGAVPSRPVAASRRRRAR